MYLKLPWLREWSIRFDNRISHIISSAFPALKMLCCFSSRSTFSTTNKDILPLITLSNLVYSVTCACERRYIGKTTERLSENIKQHVPRHLRSNHDCLIAVCYHVFDLFSVVARAPNHFHLDVLEAMYIKLHIPVLCQ